MGIKSTFDLNSKRNQETRLVSWFRFEHRFLTDTFAEKTKMMEDNNSSKEATGYKGQKGMDGFHGLLSAWLVIMALTKIFWGFTLDGSGGLVAFKNILNIGVIVGAFGLQITHKKLFFFILVGLVALNMFCLIGTNSMSAAMQAIAIIIFLLLCRLKRNGKSAYKVMGF